MNLKIPPVVQFFICASLMWATKRLTLSSHFTFDYQQELSMLLVGLAIGIGFLAVFSFKRANTTVDPTQPEKVSTLVTSGIYRYTRNPMYLALLILLVALFIWLGNGYSLFVLPLFVWYISRFQILPEEKTLTQHFGHQFIDYCKKTRRWI